MYGNTAIPMALAISYSDNIYAVKTHMFLGEDTLVDISKRLGITAKLDEVPSLPLGTASINIIEMAAAYSAFANEGYKVKGYLINKVEDLNGNVLYQKKDKKNPGRSREKCYCHLLFFQLPTTRHYRNSDFLRMKQYMLIGARTGHAPRG